MNARNALSAAFTLALATASLADDGPATSPDRDLPPHITRLTLFGERADFSHDGKRILFVEKTFGDVYEVDLATDEVRAADGVTTPTTATPVPCIWPTATSCSPAPSGSTLSTPAEPASSATSPSSTRAWRSRPCPGHQVLRGAGRLAQANAHRLDPRRATSIPTRCPPGGSRIYEADIVNKDGKPTLANRRLVLDSRDLPFRCTLEPRTSARRTSRS